jgi:DNA-binding NarL/FixJ family response regulator
VVTDGDARPLAEVHETLICETVNEGVRNAVKHGGAKLVVVPLRYGPAARRPGAPRRPRAGAARHAGAGDGRGGRGDRPARDPVLRRRRGRDSMKILVVDDHPVSRRGLRALAEEAFEHPAVTCVASGRQALAHVVEDPPDLIVLDLRMPGEHAPPLCQELLHRAPRARLVVFTAYAELEEIRECLAAGAHGCLLKDASETNVGRALQRIMEGHTIIEPRIAKGLAVAYSRVLRGDTVQLTARERDVLRLLAEGLSNKAIAARLVLAESTVKGHVSTLRTKLGATSRLHAVVQADRHGLL